METHHPDDSQATETSNIRTCLTENLLQTQDYSLDAKIIDSIPQPLPTEVATTKQEEHTHIEKSNNITSADDQTHSHIISLQHQPTGGTIATTATPLQIKELNLDVSRASYDDLDELHFDILDEREQHEQSELQSSACSCLCLKSLFKGGSNNSSSRGNGSSKSKGQPDDWLKHFRFVVRNNRFIQNSWSGGLFSIIQQRFQSYQHAESEQAELQVSAHNSIQDLKMKQSQQDLSAHALSTSNRASPRSQTNLNTSNNNNNNNNNNSNAHNTSQTQQYSPPTLTQQSPNTSQQQLPSDSLKNLKLVIQNSIILEEDIDNLRDSLVHQDIIDYLTKPSPEDEINRDSHHRTSNINNNKQQHPSSNSYNNPRYSSEYSNKPHTSDRSESKQTHNNNNNNNNKVKGAAHTGTATTTTEQQNNESNSNSKRISQLTRSINIVSGRDSSYRSTAVPLDSQQESAIRQSSRQSSRDMRVMYQSQQRQQQQQQQQQRNESIKTNTLLIDSAALADRDRELYQAAVYYKTITVIIEQHLSAPSDPTSHREHANQKPLCVLRENFVDFYVKKYASSLQSLTDEQIVDSISDLKEFLTLFLEVVREYYKLDDLVMQCPYADRFMTTDNLLNFLCAIVFSDDSIYSIVYVAHTHFERALSMKYFHTLKSVQDSIQLAELKVLPEYRLDTTTLEKMLARTKNQSVSINDSMILDAPVKIAPPFFKAIDHFKTIAHYRSPLHKLKVIIRTQELINSSIKEFYDCFGIDYSEIFYDADNLLGIFSYILIKSSVYDAIAHCKIIENFATKTTLNSQSGYLLVTLQCCIQLIASMNDPKTTTSHIKSNISSKLKQ